MHEPDWPRARTLAAAAEQLPPERVPLGEADGRILAEDAAALSDLPAFDTSAMDGWAVCGAGPWTIVGEVLAGSAPEITLQQGQGCVIATGAAVPVGATGIVRREAGEVTDGRLAATSVVTDDIRSAGQECAKGEVLADSGTRMGPATIGLLAAAGLDDVLVRTRPKVAVVLFGDELVESGIAGVGHVRDSLGPQLPGWLRRLGADVISVETVPDTLDAHVDAISRSADDADIVMTTGGTAAGPVDHVHSAVHELSGEFVVDSVAVRPGHPMAMANLGTAWLVALPGNPQSAIVSLLTLGAPLIDSMCGLMQHPLPEVTLAADAKAPATEHRLLACRNVDGRAEPVKHLGSAMLRGLSVADGFAVLPPGGARSGERVQWLDLPRHEN